MAAKRQRLESYEQMRAALDAISSGSSECESDYSETDISDNGDDITASSNSSFSWQSVQRCQSNRYCFQENVGLQQAVPVHSAPGLTQLSPYLNIDPSYLQTQPEYLTLEGASQKRGRLELAFSQIGGLCMSGATVGGAQGLYRGFLETSSAGHSGKIRRTQIINYVTKRGSAMANTLGVIAVMYSGLGCLFYYARGSKEDSKNTIAAASLTGLLYKSTSGLRKCAIGGGVGLALSSLYVAFSCRDKIKEDYGIKF